MFNYYGVIGLRLKKRYIFIFAILLVMCMSVTAFASSLSEAQKELKSISKNINKAEEKLDQVKTEKEEVRNQLDELEKKILQKEQELAEIESKLKQTQSELDNVKEELVKTEEELTKTQEELELLRNQLEEAIRKEKEQEKLNAERLKVMYMNSSTSYLEIIIESKSLNDLINRIDMITQMISYDLKVIDEMQRYRQEVDMKKTQCEEKEREIQNCKIEIERNKALLEEKEAEIQATKNRISKQKKEIQATQNEKEVLLEKLSAEERKVREELEQMERESLELERIIREFQEKARAEEEARKNKENSNNNNNNNNDSTSRGDKPSSSSLIWPVPGYSYISSYYGYRTHPIYGDRRLHKGIDIAGSGINGKPAVAAADGVVILSQFYGTYGNAVIIDHGNGISTLYAHGSSRTVSVGQEVKRGDTVLRIGSTGVSKGPHLHFEVHVNGTRVNPLDYVNRP